MSSSSEEVKDSRKYTAEFIRPSSFPSRTQPLLNEWVTKWMNGLPLVKFPWLLCSCPLLLVVFLLLTPRLLKQSTETSVIRTPTRWEDTEEKTALLYQPICFWLGQITPKLACWPSGLHAIKKGPFKQQCLERVSMNIFWWSFSGIEKTVFTVPYLDLCWSNHSLYKVGGHV